MINTSKHKDMGTFSQPDFKFSCCFAIISLATGMSATMNIHRQSKKYAISYHQYPDLQCTNQPLM